MGVYDHEDHLIPWDDEHERDAWKPKEGETPKVDAKQVLAEMKAKLKAS